MYGILTVSMGASVGCDTLSEAANGVTTAIGVRSGGGTLEAALASAATAVAVQAIQERQATQAEQEKAESAASKELSTVSTEQKSEMKQSGTVVAVPVSDNTQEGTTDVMLVDPESGKAVNDKVYTVESKQDGVESGKKIELDEYEAIYVDN